MLDYVKFFKEVKFRKIIILNRRKQCGPTRGFQLQAKPTVNPSISGMRRRAV
jgi:hypothetical protein